LHRPWRWVGQLAASDLRVVAISFHEGDAGFRLGAFACQLSDCLWPRYGRRLTERGAGQYEQGKLMQ
ncbi:MAG TPA: hypothetical protein VF014_02370, partial [Casimicrobiaceae bacterium]|nr:hypothetical protein [Casimicrobiaceae bacterium]